MGGTVAEVMVGTLRASGVQRVYGIPGDSLSFVELEMKAAGIVTDATDLDNPDFAAIARAAGLAGYRVERSGQLNGFTRYATNLRDLEIE